MKKSGTCIKCNSSEVYSNRNDGPRGERSVMAGPGGKISTRLFIHAYICVDCGYCEEYINESDLGNEKKMEKIKSNWDRMS